MISNSTLYLLGKITNFGFYLHFHPYKFCKKTRKFSFYRRSHIGIVAALVFQLCFQAYLIFRCIQISKMSSSTPSIMQFYATFIYTSLNFNHWITLRHYGSHHLTINAFLVATENLRIKSKISNGSSFGVPSLILYRRRNNFPSTLKKCDLLSHTWFGARVFGIKKLKHFNFVVANEWVTEHRPAELKKAPQQHHISKSLYALCFTFAFSSLFRALAVFRNPGLPEMYTSLTISPTGLPIFAKLFFFILHFYLSGFQCYSMTLHGSVILCYVSAIRPILRSFRWDIQHAQSLLNI